MELESRIDDPGREYSRVNAYIPLHYRILPPEERGSFHARISGDSTTEEYGRLPGGAGGDPQLEEWFKILNSKIDTVIRLMNLRQEGFFGLSSRPVNISGGGIGFFLPEAIPLGEMLELKLALTFQQPVILYVYGEVVKSNPMPKGNFIAVHYVNMDDGIRDLIVRFVFEREREILREMRK